MSQSAKRQFLAAVLAASVLAVPLACGDGPASANRLDPRQGTLQIVSGDNQSAEVGSLAPAPLVIRALDPSGNALRGVVVRLSGASEAAETTTDAAGRASLRWRLLGVAGQQRVIVQANLRSKPSVEFHATARPGPTAELVRVASASTTGFAGEDVDTIVVLPRDRYGNVTFPDVEWSVTKGGGVVTKLGQDRAFAHRAIWKLGPQAGENELSASVEDVRQRFIVTAVAEAFVPMLIVAGGSHSCALSAAGRAYCWGDNNLGQLGVAQGIELAKSPIKVSTDVVFTSLAAGGLHTCGLTVSGDAYCWGFNRSGQLGSLTQLTTPTRVSGGVPPMMQLSAGANHTCGLTRAGVVYCWGDNTFGQIGDGIDRSATAQIGSVATPEPVAIGGERRFVAVTATWSSTCAIATSGETYCWGSNGDRELGSQTTARCRIEGDPYESPGIYDAPCSSTPVRVDIGVRLTSLTAYTTDWCGISVDSELWCWGAGLTSPRVAAPRRFAKAWVIEHVACALERGGSVSCWGPWYQPGVERRAPYGEGLALVDLSSTSAHTCGVLNAARREAFCWGANYRGEIGDGTTIYRPLPRRVLPPAIN